MARIRNVVILFDVDNTLLDNDRIEKDILGHLARLFGPATSRRYRSLVMSLRRKQGYVDFLGALELYRNKHLHDPRILGIANWMVDYPFKRRLYRRAMAAVRRARRWGLPVILSDGDAVFQPRKVQRSGLWKAFRGKVLICIHKEKMLRDIERLYPARRYVVIDDKLRLLAAFKKQWNDRVTTVFVRQGHYTRDQRTLRRYPPADVTLARIGQLRRIPC